MSAFKQTIAAWGAATTGRRTGVGSKSELESTMSLARCNYMSVTRILNENRCVVCRTNDSNFRVTCGKCLNPSRGHGPTADLNGGAMPGLELASFCALCMPNGKEPSRWRRMKLERHYCKSLALFISNLSASVPRLRLKCQPPSVHLVGIQTF